MFYGFLAFLFAVLLGVFAYLLLPYTRARVWALVSYLVTVLAIYAGATEMLGNPKPYSLEWRDLEGVPVIGFRADREQKRVYVWTLRNGEPVAYALPLRDDEKTADIEMRFRRRQVTGEEFFLSTEEQPEVAGVAPAELPAK